MIFNKHHVCDRSGSSCSDDFTGLVQLQICGGERLVKCFGSLLRICAEGVRVWKLVSDLNAPLCCKMSKNSCFIHEGDVLLMLCWIGRGV